MVSWSDFFGRTFIDVTLRERSRVQRDLRHVGEPLEDGEDALKVIRHGGVCDSIVVHDLDPSQLVVGCIDLSSQNLHIWRNLILSHTDSHWDKDFCKSFYFVLISQLSSKNTY